MICSHFDAGVLVNAMRKGYWIILDELNLAPTDVLEAINRVLLYMMYLYISRLEWACSLILYCPNSPTIFSRMLFCTNQQICTYLPGWSVFFVSAQSVHYTNALFNS